MRKHKTPSQGLGDYLINIFLVVFAIFILIPLVFMFTASIMPATEIMKLPYPWISKTFRWQNYWFGLRGADGSFLYIRNIFNSLVVATSVSVTTVLLSAMAGYGLAKFKFKGRNAVFLSMMATMMIPFEVIMIPLYMVTMAMRIQDTYLGLILPFLTTAFGVFMMRQFLLTFPDEILDAARIDGSGEFYIFSRIVLPNCGPAITTLGVLTFRSQWDSLLWPLMVIQTESMKTIPQYITKYMAETHTDEGIMMAIAVIASLPMIILFLKMSKYFINSNLYASAKG
ncbi:MAG TPA: carbohydrate ABC transporter permease [Firmicutes bacterium]|uniref:Carbohydrate ABC transporter permease n=1 Tax=Capillibacterium thermochitinicola TaxID=2699427 RepID=A0A8J6LN05_9FIRM|nr:carbohydrate ABC transporter permease [Capillibacterium thermochitinicola]MBA2133428.1 carbohydrate ABC transporter permease [Capillibacterium thermochitinicola]HHW11486.1 carbohydrate ABC transporter permease [Bacillota bacterium]